MDRQLANLLRKTLLLCIIFIAISALSLHRNRANQEMLSAILLVQNDLYIFKENYEHFALSGGTQYFDESGRIYDTLSPQEILGTFRRSAHMAGVQIVEYVDSGARAVYVGEEIVFEAPITIRVVGAHDDVLSFVQYIENAPYHFHLREMDISSQAYENYSLFLSLIAFGMQAGREADG